MSPPRVRAAHPGACHVCPDPGDAEAVPVHGHAPLDAVSTITSRRGCRTQRGVLRRGHARGTDAQAGPVAWTKWVDTGLRQIVAAVCHGARTGHGGATGGGCDIRFAPGTTRMQRTSALIRRASPAESSPDGRFLPNHVAVEGKAISPYRFTAGPGGWVGLCGFSLRAVSPSGSGATNQARVRHASLAARQGGVGHEALKTCLAATLPGCDLKAARL